MKTREQQDRYNETERKRWANDSEYRERKKTYHNSHCGTWKTWSAMKQRVLNPKNKKYHLYKDRHIDPLWMVFENFYADMGDRPEGHTLERIDNSKGYALGNCVWATPAQQAHNMAVTKLNSEKADEIRSLKGLVFGTVLAKKYGISSNVIYEIWQGNTWKEVAHV